MQPALELGAGLGVALLADVHLDPGLGEVAVATRLVGRPDVEQLAVVVAPHAELGVDHEVHRPALEVELGGDRVDEEAHVVGDDLDDGVPGRPPLPLDRGRAHAHGRPARLPAPGALTVGQRSAEQVLRPLREQVLGGEVRVVVLEERAHLGRGRGTVVDGRDGEVQPLAPGVRGHP